MAAVAAGDDAGPARMCRFRGTTLQLAVAAPSVVVGDDGCCYCCCRKTFGPARYPGGTPARSKGLSYKSKLVALAGAGAAAAAVGSAGVKIAVGVVCSGLFGRSVGLESHCFAFGDLGLLSGSWTYW